MPINLNHSTNQITTGHRPAFLDVASGTNFDLSLANIFLRDAINENVTFTVSNTFPLYNIFTLNFIYTSGVITWFSAITWDGSSEPVWGDNIGKIHEVCFKTYNGGANWQGQLVWIE
jgi:hypothetical protein